MRQRDGDWAGLERRSLSRSHSSERLRLIEVVAAAHLLSEQLGGNQDVGVGEVLVDLEVVQGVAVRNCNHIGHLAGDVELASELAHESPVQGIDLQVLHGGGGGGVLSAL